MADFIWKIEDKENLVRFKTLYKNNTLQLINNLFVFGSKKTYTYIKKNKDFILAIGYCCFQGESIDNTLTKILHSFNKSKISELKSQLIGQYILIIKKNGLIFIFGDFWQTRNIFYSRDFKFISSSISTIENILGTNRNKINIEKTIEYIIMHYILYPCWLGNKTMHNDIFFLKPFEYIMIDISKDVFLIGKIYFTFNNVKNYNLDKISSSLLDNLRKIIENPAYKDKKINVTLTGGYDSRLVFAIALKYYNKILVNITTGDNDINSIRDSKISKKITKKYSIPFKVYHSSEDKIREYIKSFYFLTEGFSSYEIIRLFPQIEDIDRFEFAIGGRYGTELFGLIGQYKNIEEYIKISIVKAKKFIKASDKIWKDFYLSVDEEFKENRKHYIFSKVNISDEIRIFNMLCTASYSSSLIAAYNRKGLSLEPYSHFNIIKDVFKIPSKYVGVAGISKWTDLVKKKIMLKEYYDIGKIMTTHFQPMLPCNIKTIHLYLLGLFEYSFYKAFNKINTSNKKRTKRVRINNMQYISNSWDLLFLKRLNEKYNIKIGIF